MKQLGLRFKPCRACGHSIVFLKTDGGKTIPVNAETVLADDWKYEHGRHVSHFATCPKADAFRKRDRHTCHWPGCNVEVPPRMWGCKPHWFRLPRELRDRIWRTYRPGQEKDKNPSPEYVAAAQAARKWITDHHFEARA